MNIEKRQNGDQLLISLEGHLDTMTAPELDRALKDSLEGIAFLTIDMAKLDYISSAGLRVLLSINETMMKQGGMKVIHASEIVREVFEVTGFSDIMTIE